MSTSWCHLLGSCRAPKCLSELPVLMIHLCMYWWKRNIRHSIELVISVPCSIGMPLERNKRGKQMRYTSEEEEPEKSEETEEEEFEEDEWWHSLINSSCLFSLFWLTICKVGVLAKKAYCIFACEIIKSFTCYHFCIKNRDKKRS